MSSSPTPTVVTVSGDQEIRERPPRDLSPEKQRRDLSPDKRAAQPQTAATTDQEVRRLLKRVPRDPSPEKRATQLSSVSDEDVTGIFKTLTTYTLLIIAMPIVSYFAAKKYVFEDMMGCDSRQAFIYWAVLAVVSIHVVLGVMVYRAYQDGIAPTKQIRAVKQD